MKELLLLTCIMCGGCNFEPTKISDVNWNRYSPVLKERIIKNIESRNCRALQADFDRAYENSNLKRRRTGKGNSELMALLDDKMMSIGCYR